MAKALSMFGPAFPRHLGHVTASAFDTFAPAVVRRMVVAAAFCVGAMALGSAQNVVAQVPGGTSYGTGCGGAGGAPTLAISPPMRPGFTSTLSMQHLPANQPGVLMFGDSRTNYFGIPLPLPLAGLGLPGCELLIGPQSSISFFTGNGQPSWSFGVPLTPVLAAHPIYLQAMFADPAVGIGFSRGYDSRFTPMPTPTTMKSSITQFGITFQFAQPVPAGQFVNGDWFVVGPATLVGMTPPTTLLNGRALHGAMINPSAATRQQGYDGAMYGPGNEGEYIPALNVALNLSASNPRLLQPNQSLVKTISNTDPNYLPQLQTCAVLTVLAETPPNGSFRPPYAGNDHQVRYDEQLLDLSRLAALAPASGIPDVNLLLPKLERPWLDHAPGWTSRYMHPVLNMPDYGRDFTSLYNEAALLCNSNLPMTERRALAIKLVQIGIDCWGNISNGCRWEGTGGHGSGRKLPILFAGALLRDADMLSVGQQFLSQRFLNGTSTAFFGEDCQTFYVAQTGSTINWGYGGYVTSDIGTPEYGFAHVNWPSNDHKVWLQDSYRRCCTANAWVGGIVVVRAMGLVSAWNHPALFDYMDRYMATEPSGWTRGWSGWCERMWDLHRASL